jgi:hypothetical protein
MRATTTSLLMAAIWLCTGIAAAGAQPQNGPAGVGPDQGLGQQGPAQPSGPKTAPGSLSHQLSRSGGVIHPPPSADKAIVSPPNQSTSRTPVIPPPGTPGGNPLVQPK